MSKKDFSCYYCDGKVVSKKQDVDFRWGDKLFVVKNVPVLECKQCGEKYYSADVSERLDKFAEQKQEAKEFIKVPVFDWLGFEGRRGYA